MSTEKENPNNYIPFFEKIKELFENSDIMAVILDESFGTVWCSSAAKSAYPSLMTAHGILDLLWGRRVPDIKQEILMRGHFKTPSPDNPFSHPQLTITAMDEHSYFMLLHPLPFQGSGTQPEGLSLVLGAFESGVHGPLGSIFSALGVLSSSALQENENNRPYLSAIEQNAFLLLRSFDRVLRYTRLSNRLFAPQRQRIDIWQHLREISEATGSLIEPNGIPLYYNIPGGFLFVSCDTTLLNDVLFNIFSNSAKYTKPGNYIEISARELRDMISVLIVDHGLGIPPDVLARVQEPYYSYSHGDAPLSSIGLGLPIAREAISLLGGSLQITSRPNEGTRIQFTLPKKDEDDTLPVLHCEAADYLDDRFSPLRVALVETIGAKKE